MRFHAPRRLGIVGAGVAGALMSRAVLRSNRFVLTGLADPDPDVRNRVSAEWGCPAFIDATELVTSGTVDVVYVAAPTAHHLGAVSAAAAAGVHIICEKPLATTAADAREAVDCARRAGVSLLVGPTLSYDPRYRVLQQVVTDRRLGDLLSVQATSVTDWHRRRIRTAHDLDAAVGNGLLLRQGAHQIDIVRLICGGDVRAVSGVLHGGVGGAEQGFSAQLSFANGVQANAYYDGSGAVPEADELFATFTGGGVRVHPGGLHLYADGQLTDVPVDPATSVWDQALVEMDQTLDGRIPIHDGEWGLGTLATCLAIYEAAATHSIVFTHQSLYQEKS